MNSLRSWALCVIAGASVLFSSSAYSQVSISIDIAPPPLIVEDQPPCPDDGYLWTPGYWAYDPDQGAYYWVPGAWVQPPEVGLLWTPDYWGWDGNDYVFYPGYWGPTVGFYGGVNYGHGYWGHGYGGGHWDNGHFAYNTAANNVGGGHFHNTYTDRSLVRSQSSRVSYNGGKGGLTAKPSAKEQQSAQQNHIQATPQQQTRFQTASQQRSHEVKVNSHKTAAAGPGGQGPQSAPGAAPAVKPDSQFTGEKPAATPPSAPVNKPDAQFTGEKPEAQHDQTVEKKSAPESAPMVEHAPASAEQHPPESHQAQGPGGGGGGDKPHDKPESHPQGLGPQAQSHPDAKPQGGGGGDHHEGDGGDHSQGGGPQGGGPQGGGNGGPGGGDKH